MPINADRLRQQVEAELSEVSDERVVARIRQGLREPAVVMRRYEFSTPMVHYPCWLVWKALAADKGVAFAEHGFGPRRPWGEMITPEAESGELSMGHDDHWHRSFLEAWLDVEPPLDLPIWRLSRSAGGVVEYLSERGDWRELWEDARFWRERDAGVFYYSVDTDVFPRMRRSIARRKVV